MFQKNSHKENTKEEKTVKDLENQSRFTIDIFVEIFCFSRGKGKG